MKSRSPRYVLILLLRTQLSGQLTACNLFFKYNTILLNFKFFFFYRLDRPLCVLSCPLRDLDPVCLMFQPVLFAESILTEILLLKQLRLVPVVLLKILFHYRILAAVYRLS